ncbi:hypothetical protein SAMN05216274_11826 [Cryobacterium levicorallinum]|uniref:Uncharacterized protein n=1 Tax=Cryobacterium levicorallinum TaxID=995038 RepID=A0ABY1EHC5_9MICO|nr:hypothetical protein SAMN05216274_11826 [Cryobacterium levicorallinum]
MLVTPSDIDNRSPNLGQGPAYKHGSGSQVSLTHIVAVGNRHRQYAPRGVESFGLQIH